MSARAAHHAALVERFLTHVRALVPGPSASGAPARVLDVGSGAGRVLAALQGEGLRTVGLEPGQARALELRTQLAGVAVVRASSQRLPFADASFDLALLRHVLHHFREPWRALDEALRVARSGLVIAEPWRNPKLPAQREALALDRWMKARDRARGEAHEDDMAPEEIVRRITLRRTWTTSIHRYAEARLVALSDFEEDLEDRSHGASARELEDLARLRRRLEHTGVGLTGTAIVVAVPRL